jgi:hypothetical protein
LPEGLEVYLVRQVLRRAGGVGVVIARPGSKVALTLRDGIGDEPCRTVPHDNWTGEPLAVSVKNLGIIPRAGARLRPGEIVAVRTARHKVFGPLQVTLPIEIFRLDGTSIWHASPDALARLRDGSRREG